MTKARAQKRRYVQFVNLSGIVDEKQFKKEFMTEVLRFFGEYGQSYASIRVVKFSGQSGVIACSRTYHEKVLGFLALSSLRLRALKSSGTLKSLVNVDDVTQR